jgi:enamine deaminase RidA (YjgF/YER057c/UK114 family)
MTSIERPVAAGLAQNPAYSHVVVATGARTIYLAGQVAMDETGAVVGVGDVGAQTAQALRNIGRALAAAGAGYADIVKLTVYVVNYRPEHRIEIGQARSPFFAGGSPPASTLVGVQALAMPEFLVEIEAIAVTD